MEESTCTIQDGEPILNRVFSLTFKSYREIQADSLEQATGISVMDMDPWS